MLTFINNYNICVYYKRNTANRKVLWGKNSTHLEFLVGVVAICGWNMKYLVSRLIHQKNKVKHKIYD